MLTAKVHKVQAITGQPAVVSPSPRQYLLVPVKHVLLHHSLQLQFVPPVPSGVCARFLSVCIKLETGTGSVEPRKRSRSSDNRYTEE